MKKQSIPIIITFLFLNILFISPLFAWSGTLRNDSLQLKNENLKSNDLDTIALAKINSLKEVVVKASNITQKGNISTILINKELRHGARNTGQMLGNLNGFNCDYSDNTLTYHGSHNIMILVDSIEKPADFIKELHHLRFYKIDVIDHPQGKYSGYDVLINLYTKKDYEGYEGSVMTHTVNYLNGDNGKGKTQGYNQEQASFTYTKNKWNVVGSYGFNFNQYGISNLWKKNYYLNNLKEENIPTVGNDKNDIGIGRNHNFYFSTDYQMNKNHSFSLTYNYSLGNSRNDVRSTILRSNTSSIQADTVLLSTRSKQYTASHNVALFYRGRLKGWDYSSDFSYVNTESKPYTNHTESSGYTLLNDFKDRMNYTRFRADANRGFFDKKLFFSGGYANTWKDYLRRNHVTNNELNSNSFFRNQVWTQFSYNFSDNTQMGVGGSAELVHTKSDSLSDNQMVYSFNATFFRKFSEKNWARVNYWCNVDYPNQEQTSSYGYFVDSLTWTGGNPLLHSNVSHNVRLWIDLWLCFNVQTGYVYSPNQFCYLAEQREGILSNGSYGTYVAQTTVNSSYKEWWASMSFTKRFLKDFVYKADIKYRRIHANYSDSRNTGEDLSGTSSLRYYNDKKKLTAMLTYYSENALSILPQMKTKNNYDLTLLYVGKAFFSDKLSIGFQYFLPICFTSGKEWVKESSPIRDYSYSLSQYIRNRNRFDFTISYRFQGGKTVRQYKREMANEK